MSEDGERAMDELLAARGEKVWGNYLEASSLVAAESAMLEQFLEKMAVELTSTVLMMGHEPVHGSHKVKVAENPWAGNVKTVAAKLRAAFTARPAQFVAYCGYMMSEYSGEAGAAKSRAMEADARYQRLKDAIGMAKSLRQVRAKLAQMEDDWAE